MGRWEPGAPDRLQRAALELFVERGFEATTVADIATRAGVTERTFFRHYHDKREVLFSGEDLLLGVYVEAIDAAPPGTAARELMCIALDAGGEALETARGRDLPRARSAVVAANPALRERELLKLEKLAHSIADALRKRGIDDVQAELAGELAVSVFTVAFGHWIADGETRGLVEVQRECVEAMTSLAGG